MTVVDASALVAALTGRDERARRADQAITESTLAAPSMVRVEVLSAVRGLATAGKIDDAIAERRLRQLMSLPIVLHPVEPLLARMWQLRHNISPYDAWYVALAEALDAPLLTTDQRLARTTGARCEFWVV